MFLSGVFAVLYLAIVAVRRSTFGQRLLALKDSPAASATLGINTTLVRLAVFSLSAAIAGFGGALYGGALGAVSPQNFAFVQSLPLLLLGVVGGIGSAAGALVAGVLIGGLPLLVEAAPWFENVNRVLPGTSGSPSGATRTASPSPCARRSGRFVASRPCWSAPRSGWWPSSPCASAT